MYIPNFFIAQLWKQAPDQKLKNKNGPWKEPNIKWTLPISEEIGHIEDIASGQSISKGSCRIYPLIHTMNTRLGMS